MNTRDIFRTLLSILCVANVCLLPACKDEDVAKRSKADRVPLHPVAERLADTRLDDTAWESGDQIGIYAYDSEGALADEVNSNVRYAINPENNGCTVANDDSIVWLQKGETYSVVAYYPFLKTFSSVDNPSMPTVLVQNVSTIVGGDKPGAEQQLATPMPIYIISNWADQSDLTVLDLLWCKQEGVSADDPDVTLSLAHQFCRVQLNISIDTELSSLTADSLAGMKVLLAGKNFPAFFDLHTGEMSFNSMLSDSIAFNIQRQEGATTAVASAIIVPDTENSNTEGRTVTVQLPADNDRKYVIEIPDEIVFQSGKLYTWNVTFNTGADLSTNSFYVSATGNDSNSGKKNSPLASIAAAVALMNDPDADYTIFIDGKLTGSNSIGSALTSAAANTVTIMGANGLDETNHQPKDTLDGNGSGRVITIETSVPVTFQNLMLRGGRAENGAGIYMENGECDVTIAEGTIIRDCRADVHGGGIYAIGNLSVTGGIICKDTASLGAGIYVYQFDEHEYTVSVGGSVEISENVADQNGGGICVEGYMGQPVLLSGNARITGNFSVNQGGGISLLSSSTLVMSGDAEITNNDALNYGGGVFLDNDNDYGGCQLVMTGGTISTNRLIAGDAQGKGLYVTEGAAFTMGGAAYVNPNNDVFLQGGANNAKIYIGSLLTAESPVATITIDENMAANPTVLSEGQLYVDGSWVDATTTVAENYTKFAIWGDKGFLTNEGKYVGYADIQGAVQQILDARENTTITLSGYMTNDAIEIEVDGETSTNTPIGHITTAMASLFESYGEEVMITLDMSGVTGLTKLQSNAFKQCKNLEGITLPAGLTSIESSAFYYSSVAFINLPDGLASIGTNVFTGCSNLTSISLPEGLTAIPASAFNSCGLQTIHFPASLTTIAPIAFYLCSTLQSATLATGSTTFKLIDNALYSLDGTKLILYCARASDAEFNVPEGVKEICDYAFVQSNMSGITFPNSLETIGVYTFSLCYNLTSSMTIPSSVTSIGKDAFDQLRYLPTIIFQANVETILQGTFGNCNYLTSLTLNEGVTKIEKEAFFNCRSMESITLPASLTTIEADAFSGCRSLTTVNYCGTEAQREAMTIGDETIVGTNVTWVYNYDPNGPTYYGSNAPGSTLSVGDIVFNDGSSMPYSSTISLSDAQKTAAVAVIFDASAKKGVGLLQTALGWATADARVYYDSNFAMALYEESSDNDGSMNNYSITDDMDYYPAWQWAVNYSEAATNLTSDYRTGWYFPAKNEVATLMNNKTVVSAALQAAGGTSIDGNYWTSSLDSDGTPFSYFSGSMGTMAGFTSGFNVRAVRKF